MLQGHTAPIVALAVSPDGATLASAAWDNTVRLWPLAGGAPRVLEGHSQNVNGVAFTPDGKSVVSASYDLTVRIWPLDGGAPTIVTLPAPLSAVAVAPDEIVAAGANGVVYFLDHAGEQTGEVQASPTPVISLSVSPDGALVAAAGIRGSVAVIERKERKLARTLVGPGLPVWSVAFLPDSRTMLTGGTDRMIRRWDAVTGEHIGAVAMDERKDPLAAYAGDPGAEIYRACVACHTLVAGRRQSRRADAGGNFRAQDRDLAGLQFLRRAEEARHRVDAGNGREAVRGRPRRIHAGHENARAAHRLARGSQGADGFSGEGDEGGELSAQPSPFASRSRR